MPITEVPSASVLRNKGCPVEFAVVNDEGEIVEEKGKTKTEKTWIKFTSAACAAIEEEYARRMFVTEVDVPDEFGNYTGRTEQKERIFEGLNAWEQALDRFPYQTITKTLSILLDMSTDEVTLRMLPGETAKYSAAIGAAWAMANGLDPEDAGKLLAATLKAAQDQVQRMSDAMKELDSNEDDSPGENGSKPGSARTKQAVSEET